jgi:hypothetical protein
MRQSGRGYELVKSLEAIARSRFARDCGRKPMGNRRATQNCDHRRSGSHFEARIVREVLHGNLFGCPAGAAQFVTVT